MAPGRSTMLQWMAPLSRGYGKDKLETIGEAGVTRTNEGGKGSSEVVVNLGGVRE